MLQLKTIFGMKSTFDFENINCLFLKYNVLLMINIQVLCTVA